MTAEAQVRIIGNDTNEEPTKDNGDFKKSLNLLGWRNDIKKIMAKAYDVIKKIKPISLHPQHWSISTRF